MAARHIHDYDADADYERIVNRSRVADQPTETIVPADVVAGDAVVAERPVTVARDGVVVERPVAVAREGVVVERPFTVAQTATAEVDDLREDIAIDRVVARRALLDRVSSVIWFVFGILEATIALRVVFKLLKANEASGFVSFIYGFTEPFVRPFQGMFTDPAADGAVLNTAGIVAMIVYALIAFAIVRLMWLLFDRTESGVSRSVRRVHSDRI